MKLTVAQVAAAWSIPLQTVHSAVQDGRLPADKVGEGRHATYYIQSEDAEAYASAHRPRDREARQVKSLVDALREHGVQAVVEATRNPAAMLRDGVDVTGWYAQTMPGAVLFVRTVTIPDATSRPDEPPPALATSERRVLVVNAPHAQRATWQEVADAGDAPCTLVMAPGGYVTDR
jgi:hypothetical protein